MSYRSYYLYQKYQSINGSTPMPVYPMEYSYDGEGTMQPVVKSENDVACGYVPPTEPMYQWVVVQGEYICEGYTKYEKMRRQVSYDGGFSWENLDEYTKGNFLQGNSPDCGYIPPSEPIYRTVSGSPYCDGYDKKEDIYNQVSYDNGSTWQNVSSSTTVIEYNSEDCGYVPPSEPIYRWVGTGEYICLSGTSYESQYLTIESLEDNNAIYFRNRNSVAKTISASTDGGNTWTAYTSSSSGSGTTIATLNSGQKVLLKGVNSTYYGNGNYNHFMTSKKSNVYGNIMSLISGDSFVNATVLTDDYALSGLFYSAYRLISAENLVLPATTLTEYCYMDMFKSCDKLIKTPKLPATTLTDYCYKHMFYACTSLTTSPVLPATTLGKYCYEGMFINCWSLTTAPDLPATTLAEGCYYYMFGVCTSLNTVPSILPATTLAERCYERMFGDCTSLTTAPVLPATTLANECYLMMFHNTSLTTAPALPATTLAEACYFNMFYDCTSLTTVPSLPATTLVKQCYQNMFCNCSSLNYIKCLATDISAYKCTESWVDGVPSSGTFVKASSMNNWTTGVNGIPTGWTVQNA